MKSLYLLAFFTLLVPEFKGNDLLDSPITGSPLSDGQMAAMEFCTNGVDVVLAIAHVTTGDIILMDITDNDPSDASVNQLTSIPDYKSQIAGLIGSANPNIIDIQVNPISRAIYTLVNDGMRSYIVVVKGNGADFEIFNLENIKYSQISYTSDLYNLLDMSWGNNQLYVSSAKFSLDGEIGMIEAPFNHGGEAARRNTTHFKSNWGGAYFTRAPLERWDYMEVEGEHRLTGVTTCAPGFSFETSRISQGSGLLEVEEHYNLVTSAPIKVVGMSDPDTPYVFALHQVSLTQNRLFRIGKKWFDGSRIDANEYNNNSVMFRDFSGQRSPDLTDDDIKFYENYQMIAKYDQSHLAVLDYEDVLSLFQVREITSEIEVQVPQNESFSIRPNPTNGIINIAFDQLSAPDAQLVIYNLFGMEIERFSANGIENISLNLNHLPASNYLVGILKNNKIVQAQNIVLQ